MADSHNERRRRYFETEKDFPHRKARKAAEARRRQQEAKRIRAALGRIVTLAIAG